MFASAVRKLAGAIHTHCKEAQKTGKQCSESFWTLLSFLHFFVNSHCLILFSSPGPFLGSPGVLLLLQPWHSFHKADNLDDGVQKIIILQTQGKSNELLNLRMWDINLWYPVSRMGTHCAAVPCPWEGHQDSERGEELVSSCWASYAICLCHPLWVATSFLPLQEPPGNWKVHPEAVAACWTVSSCPRVCCSSGADQVK